MMYYLVLLCFVLAMIFSVSSLWNNNKKLSLIYFILTFLLTGFGTYLAIKEMNHSFTSIKHINHTSEIQ